MAVLRDTGETEGVEAGFAECSRIAFEVSVAEYATATTRRTRCADHRAA
jgi:hypothetical protein